MDMEDARPGNPEKRHETPETAIPVIIYVKLSLSALSLE